MFDGFAQKIGMPPTQSVDIRLNLQRIATYILSRRRTSMKVGDNMIRRRETFFKTDL